MLDTRFVQAMGRGESSSTGADDDDAEGFLKRRHLGGTDETDHGSPTLDACLNRLCLEGLPSHWP